MKALSTVALTVALAFLATAPLASALTLQTQPDTSAAGGNAAQPYSPDRTQQNLRGTLPPEDNGLTTHIGNSTLHFGVTHGAGSNDGGNQWFLDSPASRTVPSQAR
jgi:hypothetical protein